MSYEEWGRKPWWYIKESSLNLPGVTERKYKKKIS
jgi:hypothetical protein